MFCGSCGRNWLNACAACLRSSVGRHRKRMRRAHPVRSSASPIATATRVLPVPVAAQAAPCGDLGRSVRSTCGMPESGRAGRDDVGPRVDGGERLLVQPLVLHVGQALGRVEPRQLARGFRSRRFVVGHPDFVPVRGEDHRSDTIALESCPRTSALASTPAEDRLRPAWPRLPRSGGAVRRIRT